MPIVKTAMLSIVVMMATLTAVAGREASKARHGYTDFLKDLGEQKYVPLEPSPMNPAWVLSGSPTCRTAQFARSHDSVSRSGIWECHGPAQFEYHYGEDEVIYILAGAAEIEYLGSKLLLNPGDTTQFAAGTKATWTVPQHVRKTYQLHEPGRIVRFLRKVVG